jgi:hypothetical protein
MDDTGWPSKQSMSRAGRNSVAITPAMSLSAREMSHENSLDTNRVCTEENGRRSCSNSMSSVSLGSGVIESESEHMAIWSILESIADI